MLGEFKLIIDAVSTACTIKHSSKPVYYVFDFYCRSTSSEPHIVWVVCVCGNGSEAWEQDYGSDVDGL